MAEKRKSASAGVPLSVCLCSFPATFPSRGVVVVDFLRLNSLNGYAQEIEFLCLRARQIGLVFTGFHGSCDDNQMDRRKIR